MSATLVGAIRSLPRTVWLIGLISLLNDSASEMIYPLVPLYLASVLMAGPRALGLIEGIAEAAGPVHPGQLLEYQGVGALAAFGFSAACALAAALLLPIWALRGTQPAPH
jgi:hypothetical protein